MENIELLQQITLFKSSSESEIQSVIRYMEEVSYRENREIYRENEVACFIYVVLEGEVELTILLEEGKNETICGLGKNEIFGTGEIFFDNYYCSASTRSACRLLRVSRKDFFEKFIIIPSINKTVMDDFASMVKFALTKKQWNTSKNRLLLFFITRSKTKGHVIENGYFLVNDLTHDQIARILNLSREHVSRMMKELQNEGCLGVTKEYIYVYPEKIDPVLLDKDVVEFRKF